MDGTLTSGYPFGYPKIRSGLLPVAQILLQILHDDGGTASRKLSVAISGSANMTEYAMVIGDL